VFSITPRMLAECVIALQIVGAFEKDGQKLPHTLTGKWDTALEASMPDGSKQKIWQAHPPPAESSRYLVTCILLQGYVQS